MINSVDVFIHKPSIMKKAESYLATLNEAISAELTQTSHPLPPGTDTVKGQVVRGENHKGFPFLSLDMPQMFSKTEMFTYRTLFWWGHDLVFSLILKGDNLSLYLDRLTKCREDPDWSDIYLATTPTPWEWERTQNHFVHIPATTTPRIREIVESIQYIKLCRFYPLAEATFPDLDWAECGLKNWRILSGITTD